MLSVSDAEGLYGYSVKSLHLGISRGEYSIKLVVRAKKKNPKFSKLDVKGVSKFDMAIAEEKGLFMAKAVLDV